jgi:flagellar motor component MotA
MIIFLRGGNMIKKKIEGDALTGAFIGIATAVVLILPSVNADMHKKMDKRASEKLPEGVTLNLVASQTGINQEKLVAQLQKRDFGEVMQEYANMAQELAWRASNSR